MADDSCRNCMTYRRGECLGKGLCEYYKPAPSLDNEDIKNWPKEFYHRRYREPKPDPPEYVEPPSVTKRKEKQREKILKEIEQERARKETSRLRKLHQKQFCNEVIRREANINAIQEAYYNARGSVNSQSDLNTSAFEEDDFPIFDSRIHVIENKQIFFSEVRPRPDKLVDLLSEMQGKLIVWVSYEEYNPGVYKSIVLLQFNAYVKRMISNVYFGNAKKSLVEGVFMGINRITKPCIVHVITDMPLSKTMEIEELKKNKWLKKIEDSLYAKNSKLHEIVINGYEETIQKQILNPVVLGDKPIEV